MSRQLHVIDRLNGRWCLGCSPPGFLRHRLIKGRALLLFRHRYIQPVNLLGLDRVSHILRHAKALLNNDSLIVFLFFLLLLLAGPEGERRRLLVRLIIIILIAALFACFLLLVLAVLFLEEPRRKASLESIIFSILPLHTVLAFDELGVIHETCLTHELFHFLVRVGSATSGHVSARQVAVLVV